MPEFRMPSLGADMDEGTLLEWLVAPGDAVHRGDVIAVVDTDKAAIEVECFDEGVIDQLVVPEGRKVPVGTVLATLGGAAAAAGPAPSAVAAPPPGPAPRLEPVPAPVARGGGRVTSPLVRRLAKSRGVDLASVAGTGPGEVVHRAEVEHAAPAPRPAHRPRVSPFARRLATQAGIDLTTVQGTGAGGAVTAADVRHALEQPPSAPPTAPSVAAPAPAAPAPATPAPVPRAAVSPDGHGDSMRQAIAELMARSNREIPHYYVTLTIELTAVVEWLRDRNRQLPVGERVVPAAALLVATARAAAAVPQLNGHWVDGAFRPSPSVDLGLVVSLRRGGILVPCVKAADSLSVDAMMSAIRGLVERARAGRLRGSELAPPSITASNLGDQGVDSVLGVIYPPQVALVGFGAVAERPWAVNGLIGVRPVVVASLAADHRATDGATGARFLNHVARLLQKPEEL